MNSLRSMPSGTRVFVDTNIFVLAQNDRGAIGQTCRDFFTRIGRQDIQGFTSTAVAAETIHREMVLEAREQLSLSSQAIVEYLQMHPELVQQLRRHLTVPSYIRRLGVDILPVMVKDLHTSKSVRSNFGLMTNDSLIVAVMRTHKLRHLATHDAGFAQVTGIQVWRPT